MATEKKNYIIRHFIFFVLQLGKNITVDKKIERSRQFTGKVILLHDNIRSYVGRKWLRKQYWIL